MKLRILHGKKTIPRKKGELKKGKGMTLVFRTGILLLFFMILFTPLHLHAVEFPAPQEDIMLSEALHRLSQKYEVFFSYDETSIKNVEVSYQPEKYQNVEHALDHLLVGTALKYKVFDNRYIILYEESKEAISSLKGMVRHLETVIDSQEKADPARKRERPVALLQRSFQKQVQPLAFTVSGTVTDQDGEPLIGVNIQVKGSNKGTATDFEGNFIVDDIDENAVLVVSYVGYQTQEVPVAGKSTLTISLVSDSQLLDEVVVVGYGTQKKVNLTGSVASVGADFLDSRPLTNSSQALQGINGIYVNQAGSQPGADNATIRIRGIGTLNNNNPLVLVDGIEYSLRDINPNDIESISVLKDAASAAIYGNRAANGVILVTTKKGKEGKLTIDYNGYYGWQQATYLPDAVTNSLDYMMARNQASINEGQTGPYSDAQIEEYRTGTDPDLYPNTNWQDILYSVAPIQENSLRLSGGSNNLNYSLSLGYLDQDGILIATDAKRYSINSNMNYKYSDKLNFGAIFMGSLWDRNEPAVEVDTRLVLNNNRALPIHPNILSDGRYGDTWLITPGHNVFRHPVALAKESIRTNESKRSMINLFAEYTFPWQIKYKATFAVNNYDIYDQRFIPEVFIYNPKQPDVPKTLRFDPPNRSVERSNNENRDISFFQTLNWDWQDSRELHNVNLLAGFSRESFYRSNFNAHIEGFLGNELTELNAGTLNKDVGGTSNESHLMSYFGRANYGFQDKYLLEFNFRYDGSSRFAKSNRWGFFPSVSGAWRINNESFFQNVQSVSDMKLRASWGQLGNQNISLYSYASNININQGTTFNNAIVPGSAITSLADPDISWETTTIANIGIDLGLWNNKLQFVIDVFDKTTTDILARINVPGQVGNLAGPVTNLYGMSNKGFEVNASHLNTIGEFNFKIGGNIAVVKNKVDFLAGDEQFTTNRYGNLRIIKEGYPVSSWFLYEADGIFQNQEEIDNHAFQNKATSPGDIKYKDLNSDGVINNEDFKVAGRTTPRFTYGFNLSLDFKGFDVGAFLQGVEGVDIYPFSNLGFGLYNGAGITKDQLENSWSEDNRNAKYPRFFLPARGTQINAQNSTFWLKDASYLRLKNLQIGYSITPSILNNLNINKARLYLNLQNYLTFSKYKLTDPEKDILRDNIGDYPNAKIMSLGLNVSF